MIVCDICKDPLRSHSIHEVLKSDGGAAIEGHICDWCWSMLKAGRNPLVESSNGPSPKLRDQAAESLPDQGAT